MADPDLELRGTGGFFGCVNPKNYLASILPEYILKYTTEELYLPTLKLNWKFTTWYKRK